MRKDDPLTAAPADGITRRSALRALGIGTGTLGAAALLAISIDGRHAPAASPVLPRTGNSPTVASWRARGGRKIYIAHRGSGDVYPEHSMVAYQAAYDWGATCMEISVAITSDGLLICMHDATYDRTTNGTGAIIDQPSSALDSIRVWQPQLGAAWTRDPPEIPRLEDVLAKFGNSMILCVEAKVEEAYEPMMVMIEKYGLQSSVFIKGSYDSANLYRAQAAGYPIFSYFGGPADVTRDRIKSLTGKLRPESDVLVIAGVDTSQSPPYIADDLIAAAVATGVPVWVHPLHRRSDAQHFFSLGVQGAICASYGYIAGTSQRLTTDSWAKQAIAAGEVSKSAGSTTYAPTFTVDGRMVLGVNGVQHFMTLGDFCPIPNATTSYSIDVEVSWLKNPTSYTDAISVVFGHDDDRYYQDGLGTGTGYQLDLGQDGSLSLSLHRDGSTVVTYLGKSRSTPALQLGDWAHLKIDVTPGDITASRTDTGATITATDATVRGGYMHVGRASTNGSAAFRAFSVS